MNRNAEKTRELKDRLLAKENTTNSKGVTASVASTETKMVNAERKIIKKVTRK